MLTFPNSQNSQIARLLKSAYLRECAGLQNPPPKKEFASFFNPDHSVGKNGLMHIKEHLPGSDLKSEGERLKNAGTAVRSVVENPARANMIISYLSDDSSESYPHLDSHLRFLSETAKGASGAILYPGSHHDTLASLIINPNSSDRILIDPFLTGQSRTRLVLSIIGHSSGQDINYNQELPDYALLELKDEGLRFHIYGRAFYQSKGGVGPSVHLDGMEDSIRTMDAKDIFLPLSAIILKKLSQSLMASLDANGLPALLGLLPKGGHLLYSDVVRRQFEETLLAVKESGLAKACEGTLSSMWVLRGESGDYPALLFRKD